MINLTIEKTCPENYFPYVKNLRYVYKVSSVKEIIQHLKDNKKDIIGVTIEKTIIGDEELERIKHCLDQKLDIILMNRLERLELEIEI